jgi:pyrroloquinoline-quinone synthase
VDLIRRLDQARERWNVLRHPFYRRWSAGELSREELAFYAGEYRHAVVALADASEAAAKTSESELRADLEEHGREERAHVELWDRFADAVGADLGREPLSETMQCARAWRAASDAVEALAVLYTVEAGQPAISQTKLEGLIHHYGMSPGTDATRYFELHSELDHEHAARSRAALEKRLHELDPEDLARLGEDAVEGNWRLLDAVERVARPAAS